MNFYVASGLKNVEQVRLVSNRLKQNGWTHTYDWTITLLDDSNISIVAQEEFEGVKKADVVIILNPKGRGTHVELGMAIAFNKKIYIYDGDGSVFDNINQTVTFYWLPQIKRVSGTIEDAIDVILNDN